MSGSDEWQGKRYWIVGASEGLGRAVAKELSAAGAELILTARNQERLEALAAELPGAAHVAACDLSDTQSVKSIAAKLEGISGVILLAGYYEPMPAGDWHAEEVERMCDVNLTGIVRALGIAMPQLLKAGCGHIAFIGSLAGLRGLPGNVGYGASKAGMMHLAECMHLDLDPARYKVQLINPGFIETRLTAKNTFQMPFILTPEDAAARTRNALEGGRFCTNFPLPFALWFRFLGILPNWLYFPLVRRTMKSD